MLRQVVSVTQPRDFFFTAWARRILPPTEPHHAVVGSSRLARQAIRVSPIALPHDRPATGEAHSMPSNGGGEGRHAPTAAVLLMAVTLSRAGAMAVAAKGAGNKR